MNEPPKLPRPITAAEQDGLEYIRDLARELAAIAKARDFELVEYLLEMTCLEASDLLVGKRLMATEPPLLN